jgi:hypothetical protein
MSATPAVGELTQFSTEKADLSVTAKFTSPYWGLFHDIRQMYKALLTNLREEGVTAHSMRTEAGDGTLGGWNVTFWMLQFKVRVNVRLEQVDIQANNIAQQELDALDRAIQRVLGALAGAYPDVSFASYTVDLGFHGRLNRINTADYLSRFLRTTPQLAGRFLGCGVVLYFGPDGPATLRTATADLSGVIAGGLYVRMFAVYEGSLPATDLRRVVETDNSLVMSTLGLTREAH